MYKKRVLFFTVMLLSSCLAFADVRLPAIFSDGMILQQQSKVAVWGWADAGEKISIQTSWKDLPTIVYADKNGAFKIYVNTPKASNLIYSINFTANNHIEIKDILMGEVWVASGQSNMGFTLKNDANAKTEIPNANFLNIRYFSVERQYGLQEFKDAPGSIWKKTSPETAGSFSAVAYYFAKKIQEEKKVPVGIIFSAWGGTPAEAWTPREVLTSDAVLTKYIDRWKFIQDNAGKDSVAFNKELNNWKNNPSLKKPEEPQTFYYFKRPWREPSALFNGMIGPTLPYTIKGVIWYQGESNVGYANEYYRLFTKMIASWRQAWEQKDLPFYFVQIAPFVYADMNGAATVRDAQYKTMQTIPHTGMAVTTDVGNMKDQHPTNKKPVGDRLALIALAKNYGEKQVNFKGPEAKKIKEKNGMLSIKFKTAAGLKTYADEVGGFEVGYILPGTDTLTYKKAAAKIEGDKIIIRLENNQAAEAVRYGWLLIGEANLTDEKGLPAFPFSKILNRKFLNK